MTEIWWGIMHGWMGYGFVGGCPREGALKEKWGKIAPLFVLLLFLFGVVLRFVVPFCGFLQTVVYKTARFTLYGGRRRDPSSPHWMRG